jgi:hypothetical protein
MYEQFLESHLEQRMLFTWMTQQNNSMAAHEVSLYLVSQCKCTHIIIIIKC